MDKYIVGGKIYKNVLADVLLKIKYYLDSNKDCDIKDICDYGNELVKCKLNEVYKKSKKGMSLPFTISLNNCLGYFYDTVILKESDIIKIEFGINIDDSIVNGCDTFVIKNNELSVSDPYISFLDDMKTEVVKRILPKEIIVDDALYEEGYITTDDIRIMIESKCTENDCFPVENCTSYQHNIELGLDKWSDSKRMILNYTKYYDESDRLIDINTCSEFEKGEVYTIDLTIIPNEFDSLPKIIMSTPGYIGRLNEYNYNLKLKSSRELYNKISNEYNTNGFYIKEFDSPKERMGRKECIDNGILDLYEVLYYNRNVYSKKFTIYVNKNKSLLFN
jgi:methionine aminopeptidase